MKHTLPSLLRGLALAALCAAAAPAMAIDCAKAASPTDKLVCSDPRLKEADADLNRAYAALLKKAPDETLRDMVRDSQRRWLTARDNGLLALQQQLDVKPGARELIDAALEMYEFRTGDLAAQAKDGTPELVARAQAQRRFLAQFSGGDYAGYRTSCDMLPRDYTSYGCFATRHYQNGDRICSVDEYFATNAAYTYHYVANVEQGKPRLIAMCNLNGNDTGCPSANDKVGHWTTNPEAPQGELYARDLPKVDGEVIDDEDYAWLRTCLTDKTFPLADPTASGVPVKP